MVKNVENKHGITLGSDPEIFICNADEIVSAEGLTGGTKHDPIPISDNGHMIQEDGIALEYNIPPCSTADEFVEAHQFVQDYLKILIAANGYEFHKARSAEINPVYLQTEQAQTFGCEPDYNVYTKSENEAPELGGNLRCVGGHVHIGYPNPEQETTEKIVMMFDMLLTLPALFLDNDTRRREMYGKAGSFRFKMFGLEQRSLSNFWIHEEEDIRWVWNSTIGAVNMVLDGEADELIEKYSARVREAIDTADLGLAEELLISIEPALKKQEITT
jgi:hypothetical protein